MERGAERCHVSAVWEQVISIAGSVLTTMVAAWAKSHFERRRASIRRDQDDDQRTSG